MLESGDALTTWSLAAEPESAPSIAAVALPDHRRDYLDYEGPISEGRGSVTRVDQGNYQFVKLDPDEIIVLLAGRELIGRVILRRSPDEATRWSFSFTPFA